ncbi:transposase [Mesorhizobium kowhaii]|uniref:transposase n=1 Tax=Mesorhizobium kowhaii TaxID=1300272 RepID=UPI0035E77311
MSIQQFVQIDEEEAYAIFRQFRWPKTNGDPLCPHCGPTATLRRTATNITFGARLGSRPLFSACGSRCRSRRRRALSPKQL